MKNHPRYSFPKSRRVLVASVVVVLAASPVSLLAQASSPTTTTSPSAPDNTRRTNQPPPAAGTEYQSKAAAEVDATTDVNTRYATTGNARDKLSWGDRRFVTKAADGGQSEVQLAQLATQQATNPEVKSFAQKLVDAHSKVNAELMTLASQKNVKIDTDDDKDRAYKRLSKKTGADFDQEFVEHMIDEHEKEIKLFEKAANDAKDADVRLFASKHVGHLRDHLQQAQGLRQAVMPTGRIDTDSGRVTPGGTTGTRTTTPSSSDLPRTETNPAKR
jgi:putative membrane protein